MADSPPGPPSRDPKHKRRWDPETLVCSFAGHVAPAAEVAELRPEDAGVGIDLPDGRRMARCLRCDAWVAAPRPEEASSPTLPPLAGLDVPRRDKELRDAIVLRLIAVDRGIHAIVFGLVAAGVLFVYSNLGAVHAVTRHVLPGLRRVIEATGTNPGSSTIMQEAVRVSHLAGGPLLVLGATASAYCVIEGLEAVGLWLQRRWAEYLTAVATAGFLPFEIHELLGGVTTLRVVALILNVAVLVYLVWAKRLFGVRGGHKREVAEDEPDPRKLFAPPDTASEGATEVPQTEAHDPAT